MEKRQIQLHYPLEQIAEPIITELVTRFELEPNLLRADVDSSKGGWMIVEIAGPEERVEPALAWLRERGLVVSDIPIA